MPVRQPVLSRQRKVGSGGRGGKVGGGREVVMRERERETHTHRDRDRARQRRKHAHTSGKNKIKRKGKKETTQIFFFFIPNQSFITEPWSPLVTEWRAFKPSPPKKHDCREKSN